MKASVTVHFPVYLEDYEVDETKTVEQLQDQIRVDARNKFDSINSQVHHSTSILDCEIVDCRFDQELTPRLKELENTIPD